MKKNILIVGASRGIGLTTVSAALASGYRVRALARSASRINIEHEALEKFPGDALDRQDIEQAVHGVDAVIQALGIPINLKMFTGPIDLFSSSTRLLVPAMEAADVRRLLTVTGYGSGDGRRRIPSLQRIGFEVFLGRAYSDKDIQEDIIKSSPLDWTIVRPGVLTSGTSTDSYRVLEAADSWRNGFISRADVADFLVEQIDDPTYIKKTPVLIGRYGLPNL